MAELSKVIAQNIHGTKIDHRQLQRFTSDVLWHFVRGSKFNSTESYAKLLSILQEGLKANHEPNFIYEKFWSTNADNLPDSGELFGYPVSCLADIPLKDLSIHAKSYGQYAIGFHKGPAILHGFSPVLYVNQISSEFQEFMQMREEVVSLYESINKELVAKIDKMFVYLGTVAKSGYLGGYVYNHEIAVERQINDFYYEREWRSTKDWRFPPENIALIVIPREKVSNFKQDIADKKIQINSDTIIMPFDMIEKL